VTTWLPDFSQQKLPFDAPLRRANINFTAIIRATLPYVAETCDGVAPHVDAVHTNPACGFLDCRS
jgi:hypothetical protein